MMGKKKTSSSGLTLAQTFPWILTIGGAVGFVAAFALTIEKFHLLTNPSHALSCDINPLISCGTVMSTWQAGLFGFPNPLIGVASFAVVLCVGMTLLAGAQNLKRWFWWGLQLGTFLGVVFIHWLFYQSVYVIGALCPYCMVVWAVTIPIFWYTTLYNLRTGVIPVPAGCRNFVAFLQRHHGDILVVWFVIIIGLILNHFWYYWKTLI